MNPQRDIRMGDTIYGIDEQNHLFIVLSVPMSGQVAIASFTSHRLERTYCSEHCVTFDQQDHPDFRHETCVRYRKALLTSLYWLGNGLENRTYRRSAPVSPEMLLRIQQGALDLRLNAPSVVRSAIRASLR